MADSKKLSFSKSPILKKNLGKFYGLVLLFVGLIDVKGTYVYGHEAVWHKGKNSLKTQKMHFLPVFELTSNSLTTI